MRSSVSGAPLSMVSTGNPLARTEAQIPANPSAAMFSSITGIDTGNEVTTENRRPRSIAMA